MLSDTIEVFRVLTLTAINLAWLWLPAALVLGGIALYEKGDPR